MNRIKEVLEEKGIKQIWLAEQLGKSYNMVNSYAPLIEYKNKLSTKKINYYLWFN